ncbi:MAG: response regulator [Epulopiscium sp.]|nr:response regulator [Candidatus Epulonipiscium sp.]
MYRMLIVDDESDERKVIRFLLNKYNFNFYIEEASNGKEALEILQHTTIDILFTDIKMPFMDGIELASKVQDLQPNAQIIFFSGHDDFEYVKKAISLRAINYILKPINPIEFKNTIASVVERAETLEAEQSQHETNMIYLKNHILYRIINRTPIEVLKQEYSSIDLGFLNNYSHIFLIQFEESFFDQLPYGKEIIPFNENISRVINIPFDYINMNPSQSVLFFQEQDMPSEYYMELAGKIQEHIFYHYEVNSYISVSNKITDPNDISLIYDETEGFLESRFFFPNTYIYPKHISANNKINDSDEDNHLIKTIQRDIEFGDIQSIRLSINMLFTKYKSRQCVSHLYIKFLFSNVLQLLAKDLLELNDSDFIDSMVAIYSTQNLSEIQTIINEFLDKGDAKLEVNEDSPTHAVNLVKQYIHDHYGDDLSLNLLAEKVFLTPRYLSSIFIQEVGYGINKYIKNVRMDKAKELLLETNMKVHEICKSVGYSNVSYFCKSFLEDFGLTPEKYRQTHS